MLTYIQTALNGGWSEGEGGGKDSQRQVVYEGRVRTGVTRGQQKALKRT